VVAEYPLLRSKSYPNPVWWWGIVGEGVLGYAGPHTRSSCRREHCQDKLQGSNRTASEALSF
jgi:hypothetical protein